MYPVPVYLYGVILWCIYVVYLHGISKEIVSIGEVLSIGCVELRISATRSVGVKGTSSCPVIEVMQYNVLLVWAIYSRP